jgi:hypothetical protein
MFSKGILASASTISTLLSHREEMVSDARTLGVKPEYQVPSFVSMRMISSLLMMICQRRFHNPMFSVFGPAHSRAMLDFEVKTAKMSSRFNRLCRSDILRDLSPL